MQSEKVIKIYNNCLQYMKPTPGDWQKALDSFYKIWTEELAEDIQECILLLEEEIGGADMSYYHTCKHCGAHLDPGEKCDCEERDRDGIHSEPRKCSGGSRWDKSHSPVQGKQYK